jgi:hypothetical protein
MKLTADTHYFVKRQDRYFGDSCGDIIALRCAFCDYSANRVSFSKGASKSGQGRYNKMRAAMVKHIHAEHREAARGVSAREAVKTSWTY